jgi:hypothetical protein
MKLSNSILNYLLLCGRNSQKDEETVGNDSEKAN